MYIHNLDPVAIEFLNIKIYWYSLAYLFGFLFSLNFSKYLIKIKKFTFKPEIIDSLRTWSILGIIIGGRLGYVVFYNIDYYSQNIIEIFKIWKGGMSFHGGLIGMIISMYFFSKKYNTHFLEISNLVVCSAPVGIFLGRIANFINGELVGKPTLSNWGVTYPPESVPRHPSQLYESFLEGFLIFVIINLILVMNNHKKINVSSVFLILYGLFRFISEFFREPDYHLGLLAMGLSMGQILSIPLIFLGLSLVKYGKNN